MISTGVDSGLLLGVVEWCGVCIASMVRDPLTDLVWVPRYMVTHMRSPCFFALFLPLFIVLLPEEMDRCELCVVVMHM